MTDSAKTVADYYDALCARVGDRPTPTHFSKPERVVWYIISTRCEMDMEGFSSVFEQLLSEEELLFLIASLREIDATELAAAFAECHTLLNRAGFYGQPGAMVSELGESVEEELDAIGQRLQSADELWDLDDRLAKLIST